MEESPEKSEKESLFPDDSSSLFPPEVISEPESPNPEQDYSAPPPSRKSRIIDAVIAAFLFVIAFFSVILTAPGDYGLSWDEAYYYKPSRNAAAWLYRSLFTATTTLSENEIYNSWEEIRELPAVVKVALGSGILFFEGYIDKLTAMRIPSAAAYALTLLLLYIFMLEKFGRSAALFTSLGYGMMPRIFGHAHIAASESITVLVTLVVVICFLRGLKNPWWSVVTGIVFGLALNTRITCYFLPLILLPWAHIFHRRKYINNFFAMVFLSPIVLVITWPWLWHDPARKILEYLYFFVSHQYTAVYYFGQKYNYGATLAPWHYPLVMTIFTLPPVVFLMSLPGTALALLRIRKNPIPVLFLWGAVVMLGVASVPTSPKYDGIRLFIGAFPFIAMLAGAGFSMLLEIFPRRRNIRGAVYWRDVVAAAVILLLVITAGRSIIISHPYSLSYYNIFAGGIQGAYKKGMETTYWGEAVNQQVIETLNELPPNSRIKTLALHEEVFKLLQRWGKLRRDLEFDTGKPPWDYHLLLVRKGFFSRPEKTLYRMWPRMKVFEHRSIPLVILFRTGADFEKAWRGAASESEVENHGSQQ